MGMCLVLKEWGGVASVGEDGTEEDFQDIELKKKNYLRKTTESKTLSSKRKKNQDVTREGVHSREGKEFPSSTTKALDGPWMKPS